MDKKKEAVAYDFDATMAVYESGDMDKFGPEHIGPPIKKMVDEIKQALARGTEVFIFTARTNPGDHSFEEALNATKSHLAIAQWCFKTFGTLLPITHEKNKRWDRIVDDRADQVIPNTGVHVTELMEAHAKR